MRCIPPTILALALACITAANADTYTYNQLTATERAEWQKAESLKEKAESDIRSGNWYLSRRASSPTEQDATDRAHAAGRNIIAKGEADLAKAEAVFESLKAAVVARQSGSKEPVNTVVSYTTSIAPESGDSGINKSLAGQILAQATQLGYSKVVFDGIYTAALDRSELDTEYTAEIRSEIYRIDGTRFTLQPEAPIEIVNGVLNYDKSPMQPNTALVYGLISALPDESTPLTLTSIHFVDPSTWELRHIVNVLSAGSVETLKKDLLLEDTNQFFSRLATVSDNYSFRLSYALNTLNSVDQGSWIPAIFKELALEHGLAGIVDVDSMIYIYGKPAERPALFTARGNASFVFQDNEKDPSRVSLYSKADSSDNSILVGTLEITSAL